MKWSVPIIVLAISACILFGSIGFQETTRETTIYSPVLADLAPIAQADPVQENVNYNPLTNVTGWSPGVGFEYQTPASLYKLVTDYEYTNGTSNAIGTMGTYIEEPENYIGHAIDWEWSNGSDVGQTVPSGAIGGWSGTETFPDTTSGYQSKIVTGNVYVTLFSGGQHWFSLFKSLGTSDLPNKSIVHVGTYSGGTSALTVATWWPGTSTYNYSAYTSGQYGSYFVNYEVSWNAGNLEALNNGDFILQDGVWYHVASYDSGGGPIIDRSRTYNIVFAANDYQATFDYRTVTDSQTYYITPYTLATIPVGLGSAEWSNGYQNTRVQFIAEAEGLYFTVNGAAIPAGDPLLTDIPDVAAWASGYTGMIFVTIDGEAGRTYWQGITEYNDTRSFTVAEYQYELTSDNAPGTTVSAGTSISSITVYYANGASGRVAITDTWIPQDSNGILWGNATFPINNVFNTLWTTENIRVSFNSFVIMGTGITINGITYPIADGMISIDGETDFRFTGSAIEWEPDGDTTFVAPDGTRYDLGQRTGTFTLNGTWYGALSMDTFAVGYERATEMLFGQEMDLRWLAWVFVGVLLLGAIAVLLSRKEMDSTDFLALILAGLSGIIVAVI